MKKKTGKTNDIYSRAAVIDASITAFGGFMSVNLNNKVTYNEIEDAILELGFTRKYNAYVDGVQRGVVDKSNFPILALYRASTTEVNLDDIKSAKLKLLYESGYYPAIEIVDVHEQMLIRSEYKAKYKTYCPGCNANHVLSPLLFNKSVIESEAEIAYCKKFPHGYIHGVIYC